MDQGLAASPLLALTLIALCSLIAYNSFALWTWLRTAWILRKLPNGSGNLVYGGLSKVLAFNRMREVQKMNEGVLQGAGACFFNVLWRQVNTANVKLDSFIGFFAAASAIAVAKTGYGFTERLCRNAVCGGNRPSLDRTAHTRQEPAQASRA